MLPAHQQDNMRHTVLCYATESTADIPWCLPNAAIYPSSHTCVTPTRKEPFPQHRSYRTGSTNHLAPTIQSPVIQLQALCGMRQVRQRGQHGSILQLLLNHGCLTEPNLVP